MHVLSCNKAYDFIGGFCFVRFLFFFFFCRKNYYRWNIINSCIFVLRSCSQVLLRCLNSAEAKEIVDLKTGGATPLMMACRNGHLEVVKYLVLNCEADIAMPGSGRLWSLSDVKGGFCKASAYCWWADTRMDGDWIFLRI